MADYPLENKVIVVTGGGGGLGAALVEKFSLFGAHVIIFDINCVEVGKEIEKAKNKGYLHEPQFKEVSVTDEKALQEALDQVCSLYGSLDIMVNNAGILIAGEARDMNIEMFRRIVEINQMGVVNGSLAAYKIMVQQGYGKIVNISSISGLITSPLYSAYSMTKHAVNGFSKALREEGRTLGVDVIMICPGTLRTGIFSAGHVVNASKDQVFKESILASISLDVAVSKIIKAINANKCLTVFPAYARAMWLFEKIHPSLLKPLHQKIIKNFRSHRIE
jgi:NAD(P)-dependent dehydrogenase (short-subunit alcohol dehydrogenase family)